MQPISNHISTMVVEGVAVVEGMVDKEAFLQGDLEEDGVAETRTHPNAVEEDDISTRTVVALITGLIVRLQAQRTNTPCLSRIL